MKPSTMRWHFYLHCSNAFHAMLTTLSFSFLTACFYIYIPEDRAAVNHLPTCGSGVGKEEAVKQDGLAARGRGGGLPGFMKLGRVALGELLKLSSRCTGARVSKMGKSAASNSQVC